MLERRFLFELAAEGGDALLHRAAVLGFGILVQVLLISVPRVFELALALVRARQVVQNGRIRLDGVGLPQQLDGLVEAARLVQLGAFRHQLDHAIPALPRGRR